ncbi:MAG TPA: hypothetical protein VG755_14950 [Nannocystaceae bacterium]|nr:hypothetical protein [Nannocystaceae bacterium]
MVSRASQGVIVAVALAIAPRVHAQPAEGEVPVQRPAGAPPPSEPAPSETTATSSPAPESTTPVVTPAPAPAPTNAPTPPPTADERSVYVHLEAVRSGHALELFEVTEETGTGTNYRRACGEPCDVAVPARAQYFITSGKNTESRKFAVDQHGDRVTVRVVPGSRAAGIAGEVITAIGALMLVTGVGLLVAGKVLDRHRMFVAGGGVLGGGLGGLAIGIPVEMVAGHARVREVVRSP